jgi:hypothetical protein
MKATLLLYFSLLFFHLSLGQSPQSKPDTSLSAAAIKLVLQGVWGGPDQSYFFLFRGDSVKEWEADGADSIVKPFCSFSLSKTFCDTASEHVLGATGYSITIVCSSTDYDETKCYFIQSINTVDLQIGFKGRFDESGHFKKIKKEQ